MNRRDAEEQMNAERKTIARRDAEEERAAERERENDVVLTTERTERTEMGREGESRGREQGSAKRGATCLIVSLLCRIAMYS